MSALNGLLISPAVPAARLDTARRRREDRPEAMGNEELTKIVSAARDGDAEAVGTLYRIYRPAVHRYLCRQLHDPESADDLTSVVFVRVIEAIEGKKAWRESFQGWLFRIAHNAMVDFLRTESRQRYEELTPAVPCPRAAAMEDDVVRSTSAREVFAAVGGLRPAYARVLRMRYGEGLTQRDIGDRLGTTRGNVKITQFRALRALRLQIEGPTQGRSASRRRQRWPASQLRSHPKGTPLAPVRAQS